jgi:hypothetical protein
MHQAAIRQWREPVRYSHSRHADYISQNLQKSHAFPQSALNCIIPLEALAKWLGKGGIGLALQAQRRGWAAISGIRHPIPFSFLLIKTGRAGFADRAPDSSRLSGSNRRHCNRMPVS